MRVCVRRPAFFFFTPDLARRVDVALYIYNYIYIIVDCLFYLKKISVLASVCGGSFAVVQ